MPRAGYELDLADLRGLERRLTLRNALVAWSLIKGVVQSAAILKRRRPDAVVGCGGYVSGAPVFVAALRRLPALVIELDSHMGLANRVLAPLVSRVALCFDIPGRRGGKYMRTGRPMGSLLLGATAEAGRQRFGLGAGSPVVLVTGGSQGARSINEACAAAFGSGPLPFQLLHVSGKRDYAHLGELLSGSDTDRQNYHLLDYTDELPLAMAAADLVVGRSGASVLEVAALGKPAVLIPYPFATADHQLHNARWIEAGGGAEVINDSELTPERLRDTVTRLLADNGRRRQMAKAAAALSQRDGAQAIADEVIRLARGRR